MKVGILGSGEVAKTLAGGFLQHGHDVRLETRTPAKLAEWAKQHPKASIVSFTEAASFGDIVVLAVKGTAAAEALRTAGAVALAGKPLIDVTNPIAAAPPVNGVLHFFTTLEESLLERLQREFGFCCVSGGSHGSGKLRTPMNLIPKNLHDRLQRPPFRKRHHPALCPLVPGLSAQLPAS